MGIRFLRFFFASCASLAILIAAAAPAHAQRDKKSDPSPPTLEPAKPKAALEIDEEGAPVPGSEAAPTSPTLELLKRIEVRHGGAKTIEGAFEQVKTSEIFLEEIKSKGKFRFLKPDFFRCDYEAPDEATNLIVKEAIYVYTPQHKQVEIYRFHSAEERDQQLHVMALGLGFKALTIAREYSLQSSIDKPALVEELKAGGGDPEKTFLVFALPAESLRDTSPFVQIKLWIDKESLLPQKIWFEDYNGDKATITILEVKFDTKLDPAVFDPEKAFPPGTEKIDKSEM